MLSLRKPPKNRNSTDGRQACCIAPPMLQQGFVTNSQLSNFKQHMLFSLSSLCVTRVALFRLLTDLAGLQAAIGVRFVPWSLWLPCSSGGEESDSNAGDLGLTPRSGKSPGEGSGYPL